MIKEIWKPIPGYSSYDASNTGKIRDSDKKIVEFKKCSGFYNKYRSVTIRNDFGRLCTELVHRLVYSAFYGPIQIIKGKRVVIDHINNIKHDNRLENLQLLTQSENMLKALKDNLREDNLPITMTDHDSGTKTIFFSMMEISRYFNIPRHKVYLLIYLHKHRLFRNKYTFDIDELNLTRVNRNRLSIKVYDHADNKWLFPLSKGHATMITGVEQSLIYQALNRQKPLRAIYGYTFKLTSEDSTVPDIPKSVALTERKKLLRKDIDDQSFKRVLVELKDYVSGVIYVYNNYATAADVVKVSVEIISNMVNNPKLMVNGYCARKCNDKREFENYSKEYVLDNAENRLAPITITYLNGKVKSYVNLYDLGKQLDIPIRKNMKLKNLGIILRYRGIKYKSIVVNKEGCLTK